MLLQMGNFYWTMQSSELDWASLSCCLVLRDDLRINDLDLGLALASPAESELPAPRWLVLPSAGLGALFLPVKFIQYKLFSLT